MAKNENAIYTRRSIRKFQEKELPRETIEEIIRAGIAAPSAKNRQPWKCIVFGGKEKEDILTYMEKGICREETSFAMLPKFNYGLADAKNTLRVMREAPVLLVIINTNGKNPFESLDAEGRFVEICDSLSIGAFIENMLLQAENMGIGTLWIANTCFAYKELMEYFDMPGQLIGAVALGYADEYPEQRPRKEIQDVVEFRL